MTKRKRPNKYLIGGILLVIAAYPLFLLSGYLTKLSDSTDTATGQNQVELTEPDKTVNKNTTEEVADTIPATARLTVPYTVQAPYANWAIHEESCEEAALLMYERFLAGQTTDISVSDADRELRAMKAWQVKNYGTEPDLSIDRLGQFGASYYNIKPRIVTDLTAENVKAEIAAGHPILVPVMTQTLKNPHYSPGNVYHILLIKGYDTTGVVTNDAGVKEGKNWHYTWEVLFAAIDAQESKMKQGRVGLIYTKQN